MDVLERLNRKFGVWYEGLFGGADGGDLRPRDILRRILTAMEDGRREALDGQVYVPNVYTLQIAVANDDERDYLRTFLNAEDLAAAVARAVEQHGYQVRGALVFTVEEMATRRPNEPRVQIRCRFDATAAGAEAPKSAAPVVESTPPPDLADDGEPGTVPAGLGAGMSPLASLIVRGADGQLLDVYPLTAHGARVGRGKNVGNDIVLASDGMISKSHVAIVYQSGQFSVRDENSTNGTFLGTERLTPGRAYPLHAGDEIRVGLTVMSFRVSERVEPRGASERSARSPYDVEAGGAAGKAQAFGGVPLSPTVHPSQVPSPTPGEMQAFGGPALSQAKEGDSDNRRLFRLVSSGGEVYTLASVMTVGRGLTSDIVAIGNGVANVHARLTLRGDTLFVEDLRTTGGTIVNGERIPADFPVALYEGDQIAFGEVNFRLERVTASGGGGWR